jgi:serine/threonine-protein kinase HipA
MTHPNALSVFLGQELVGHLHDASPLAFQYAESWLARSKPFPLAAISLTPDRQDSRQVKAFFENLLPEGELRDYLAQEKKASTLFSLLMSVAGDTAGAFVIVPAGKKPEPAKYEPTSWEALAAQLGKKATAAIDIKGKGARVSLAGAQDKTSIAIFADGVPRLPRGTAPSTHILKPDIRRLAKVWHSAVNETVAMKIAKYCGLPTADVFYESNTQSSVVRRFDRVLRPDGVLDRLIQYDLCQLAGTVSERKYEKEGGPGIADCAKIIRLHSTSSVVDLRHLVSWIFFNLYTGNNDSHAKNLSMYRRPDGAQVLTPFYDLMCTRLYPGLSQEFAFSLGGETHPGSMTRDHVVTMAKELDMQPQFVLSVAAELATKIPRAVDQAVEEVMPSLPHGAKDMAARLRSFVLSTTKKTAARFAK